MKVNYRRGIVGYFIKILYIKRIKSNVRGRNPIQYETAFGRINIYYLEQKQNCYFILFLLKKDQSLVQHTALSVISNYFKLTVVFETWL